LSRVFTITEVELEGIIGREMADHMYERLTRTLLQVPSSTSNQGPTHSLKEGSRQGSGELKEESDSILSAQLYNILSSAGRNIPQSIAKQNHNPFYRTPIS
jgi:hypothetical protein